MMVDALVTREQLNLPVLPEGYVWHIRPDQGDGEFQLYPRGTTLLITLDRTFNFLGRQTIRATGARGFYVNAAATNEYIEQVAREIYTGWVAWRAWREAEIQRASERPL